MEGEKSSGEGAKKKTIKKGEQPRDCVKERKKKIKRNKGLQTIDSGRKYAVEHYHATHTSPHP